MGIVCWYHRVDRGSDDEVDGVFVVCCHHNWIQPAPVAGRVVGEMLKLWLKVVEVRYLGT